MYLKRQDWGDDGCRQEQQLVDDQHVDVYFASSLHATLYMKRRDQSMGEHMDDIADTALA